MQIINIKDKLPEDFVNIHNEAFKEFFLTTLGTNFLKLYYSSVIKNSKGLVVCLFDENDRLAGFAVGATYSKGFHKELLLKNIFSYIWVLINVILFRPKSIFRLLKNLNKNKNKKIDNGDYAELLSIAVPPNQNGKGYGKLLLQAFEKELESLNVKKIALTTDFHNNDNVLAFYKKTGYEFFYEFITFPNRKMYKLIKNI